MNTITSAATAVSRRKALGLLAAVAVPPTAVVAVAAAAPVGEAAENPDLVAAHERFLAAQAELASAKDALEWLADEWKHRWPLAPEEILNGADAGEYTPDAERDIAGRIITRDTADLTKRMSRRIRQELPKTCFSIYSPETLQVTVDEWEKPRTGRTAKALANNIAMQTKVLSEYRHKLRLCEKYHAETARLREASGVGQVKKRIKSAEAAMAKACSDVSYAPAYTTNGLHLKAEALQAQDDGLAVFLRHKGGAMGGMARFIDATLAVIGGASV